MAQLLGGRTELGGFLGPPEAVSPVPSTRCPPPAQGLGQEACHILSQWFAAQFIPGISEDVGAFAGAVSS